MWDDDGRHASIRATSVVADKDTLLAPVSVPRPATVGQPVAGQIAIFSNAGYPNNAAGDFSATVDWGDGAVNAGAVSNRNGLITVSGSHTYSTPALYWAVITVYEDGSGAVAGTTRVPIDVSSS